MLVQPRNINICDERPIEEELWAHNVPCHRVEFGDATLASIVLTDSRELLFRHPALSPSSETFIEISVVYHRAGYDIEEYDDAGMETRYLLERSRAIKCPSVLCHMATLKIVQQRLAVPGTLERFLPPDEASRVAETFAPMYPLDPTMPSGERGITLATSPDTAANHVLKPCLEGGGHNIYRNDIPTFLASVPRARRIDFILMEMINSPPAFNYLLLADGLHEGPTISELGVFGTVLWRRKGNARSTGDPSSSEGVGVDILQWNENASFSLKTKPAEVNEMSVVKGYGCFDSPLLV